MYACVSLLLLLIMSGNNVKKYRMLKAVKAVIAEGIQVITWA